MDRRVLNYQADRIEEVLLSHRVSCRVSGGTVTPRFVRFRLTLPMGSKVKQIASLAEEIALSLGVASCRIFRQGADVNIDVPRDKGGVVRLLALCKRLDDVPPCTAVLGVDDQGAPLLLRLSSPDVAHVLIAGTTGSGKTELARSMVASLALFNRQSDTQLLLIDPKGRGFGPFRGAAHLLGDIVREPEDAAAALQRLTAEMERRDADGCQRPRIVLFLDELADLVATSGAAIEEPLSRLLQRGRGAGIHVVACTQKPTAAVIGSLVKSNFPVRIVGSVASPEDAKVASGLAGTGAERLLGRGDFVLVTKGRVIRLQAAYAGREDLAEVVRLSHSSVRSGQRVIEFRGRPRGWVPRLVQKVAGGQTSLSGRSR